MNARADGARPGVPERGAVSLRGRLLRLLLAPVLLLLVVALVIDWYAWTPQIRDAYDRALAASALAVAAAADDGEGHLITDAAVVLAAAPPGDPRDRVFFRIDALDGTHLAGDDDLPAAGSPWPSAGSATAGGRDPRGPAVYADARHRGLPVRVVTREATIAGRAALVSVAETTNGRAAASRALVATAIVTDGVVFGAVVLAVYVGVLGGLRPLLDLRERLVARSASELTPLEERSVPSEVRPLVAGLNAMFGRVRSASAAQERFLADAAHQLRTPLTGLTAQLDLLIDEAPADPRRPRLVALRDAHKRLQHTANQLLALSRAGAPLDPGTRRPVDLRAIVEQAVGRELDRALAHGLDLGAEAAAAELSGSDWLLRELVANLLDNALTYTPPGGTVTVRCGRDGAGTFVEVEDDGPGIPPAERARVVERFQRGAGATGSGCGLGLSIVDDIARLHGGSLALLEGSAGGTAGAADAGRAAVAGVEHGAPHAPPRGPGLRARVTFPA